MVYTQVLVGEYSGRVAGYCGQYNVYRILHRTSNNGTEIRSIHINTSNIYNLNVWVIINKKQGSNEVLFLEKPLFLMPASQCDMQKLNYTNRPKKKKQLYNRIKM